MKTKLNHEGHEGHEVTCKINLSFLRDLRVLRGSIIDKRNSRIAGLAHSYQNKGYVKI